MLVGNDDRITVPVRGVHACIGRDEPPEERTEVVEDEPAGRVLGVDDFEEALEYVLIRCSFVAELREPELRERVDGLVLSKLARELRVERGDRVVAALAAPQIRRERKPERPQIGADGAIEEAVVVRHLDPGAQFGRELPCRLLLELDARLVRERQQQNPLLGTKTGGMNTSEPDRQASLSRSRRRDDDEVPSLSRADSIVIGVGPELAQPAIGNSPPAGQPVRIHSSSPLSARANGSGTPSAATIASATSRAWRAPLISNGVTPFAPSALAMSARASASSSSASRSDSVAASFIASRVSCATFARLTKSSRCVAQS